MAMPEPEVAEVVQDGLERRVIMIQQRHARPLVHLVDLKGYRARVGEVPADLVQAALRQIVSERRHVH